MSQEPSPDKRESYTAAYLVGTIKSLYRNRDMQSEDEAEALMDEVLRRLDSVPSTTPRRTADYRAKYSAFLQEKDQEAAKWKSEGDMYGWNFHMGARSGAVGMNFVAETHISELERELAEAQRDRDLHRRAAHEADMRTQAAVRSEKAALSAASAIARRPKYIVMAGGECPQDWLCDDLPEVQAALCEAIYGRAEDAEAEEIGKYLRQVREMTACCLKYEFEDGWVQIFKLLHATDGGKQTP